MKYQVLRQHLGDRLYNKGEDREARESDVAHLVRTGVLLPMKAEPVVENKAEPRVANKSRRRK